jgi:hypothetical protein
MSVGMRLGGWAREGVGARDAPAPAATTVSPGGSLQVPAPAARGARPP